MSVLHPSLQNSQSLPPPPSRPCLEFNRRSEIMRANVNVHACLLLLLLVCIISLSVDCRAVGVSLSCQVIPELSTSRVLTSTLVKGLTIDQICQMDQFTRNKVWSPFSEHAYWVLLLQLRHDDDTSRFAGRTKAVGALFA